VTKKDDDQGVVAAVVLVGLVLSAGLAGMLRFGGVVLLAAVSLLWLLVNGPMEGPVLVVLSPDHGITGADLAGCAGLALAAARLVMVVRSSAGSR
jgi:hypothetical protein